MEKIVSENKIDSFLKIKFRNGKSEVIRMPADGSIVTIENQDLMDIKEAKTLSRTNKKLFFFSIKRKNKCLFSRRNGHIGKLFLGLSICIRVFGKDVL